MRRELFYNPSLLIERCAQELTSRARLRQLKRSCAEGLTIDHIDSLELIRLANAEGARVFYDIGANVGTWSLLCRALVPDSVIIAFEPMEEHLSIFQNKLGSLSNVTLLPFALGACNETKQFFPASFTDASSFLPLNATGREAWHIENTESRMLNITSLDAAMENHSLPAPDLLKLDVQGFEVEVFKGATKALQLCRWVLCEVSFQEFYKGQCRFSDVTCFLSRHGFEVRALGQRTPTGQFLQQTDVLFGR
jgi:FkbM family methyltransferase